MATQRQQDAKFETDGVLVRPIGGQIYLIEEKDLDALFAEDEAPPADSSRLSGLVNRH